jgi:Amt family ammonium transporter
LIPGRENQTGARSYRAAKLAATINLVSVLLAAPSLTTPALARTAEEIGAADTAWMIVATALVLMMTIPGLALFYSGMVRKKNVLGTMAQSLGAVGVISILWVAFGYSLVFVGDGPWLGSLDRWFLSGMTMDRVNPAAKTIPEGLFVLYGKSAPRIDAGLRRGRCLGLVARDHLHSFEVGRLVRPDPAVHAAGVGGPDISQHGEALQ